MKQLLASIITIVLVYGVAPGVGRSFAQAGPPAIRHYVVFLNVGPRYDPKLPPLQQPGIGEHAKYMSQLEKEGKLLLGGPLIDGAGGAAVTGVLIILAADSLADARRLEEADPAVTSGLMAIAEVKPWMPTGGVLLRPWR